MIELKNVSFQYEQGNSRGKIENIDLTIHDGEVVLLCGESGCGKTTLTRLINGLIPHYYEGTLTGETIVEGIDVKNVSLKYGERRLSETRTMPGIPLSVCGADIHQHLCHRADAGHPRKRGDAPGKRNGRPEEGEPACPLPGYAGGL